MPSYSPPITPYIVSPNVADLVIVDGRVQYRDESQRRKKVAICGAPGVKAMPWDDTSYECWAINNFWETARDSKGRLAASRWWEQHQIFPDTDGLHSGEIIQNEQDMQWIRECPVPLYTTEPFPDNTNAVVWPLRYFLTKYRDYFTCTFAYQIAQALEEGFDEIRVCGLELLNGTKREATVESSCVNYWLGLAEGRGVTLDIPPITHYDTRDGLMYLDPPFLLMHPYRYGHEYWAEADFVKEYVSRWDARKIAV